MRYDFLMSWIDDRLTQRRRRGNRDSLIASNAEKIYNELWHEVNGWIEAAQEKGIDLIPNGSPYERTITLPDPPHSEPRVLTLSLNKAAQLISVSGLKSNFQLKFDVCADNRVCLKRGESEILLHDAAQQILDPFIFPEFAS